MSFDLSTTLTATSNHLYSVYADSDYVYAGSQNEIYIYDKTSLTPITKLTDPVGYIYSVYADSDYIYVSSYNGICIYDRINLTLITTLTDVSGIVYSIYVNEDYIYAGSYNGICIYDRADLTLITILTDTNDFIFSVYTDSNYIYAGSRDNKLYIYDRIDFTLVTTFTDANNIIRSVYADSDYIYAGSSDKIYVYNKTNLTLITTLTDPVGYIYSIYVDSNYIYAGAHDKNIYIYDRRDLTLVTKLTDATGYIYSVYADNDYLYAASYDNNVYIYGRSITNYIEASADFSASAIISINSARLKNSSANILSSGIMTTEIQKITGHMFEMITGNATITLASTRIREVSANMVVKGSANIRPYIIANVTSDMLGQTEMTVRSLKLIIPTGLYEITADDYFTKNQPADSSSVANYIIVETQPLVLSDGLEEVFSTSEVRTIGAAETITINAEYSEKPAIEVTAHLENNTVNTSITHANYYACNAEIEISNSGTSQDTFKLILEGKPLKVKGAERVYSQDDRSITENGKIDYTLPINHLIQTKEMAQKIADKLKGSFADPKRDVSLDWRGNPALILADLITVPEFQKLGINKVGQFYVTKQELEYDGGLRANLEGRKNE